MTAKKAPKKGSSEKETPTFDEALKRLELIVDEMESGELGLEDMISRFEQGRKLVEFCSTKLNEVERKIEVLVQKGCEVVAEPLDVDAPETGT